MSRLRESQLVALNSDFTLPGASILGAFWCSSARTFFSSFVYVYACILQSTARQ